MSPNNYINDNESERMMSEVVEIHFKVLLIRILRKTEKTYQNLQTGCQVPETRLEPETSNSRSRNVNSLRQNFTLRSGVVGGGGGAKFVGSLVGYSVAKRCGNALYDVMFSSLWPVKYLLEKVRCVTTLKTLAPRTR